MKKKISKFLVGLGLCTAVIGSTQAHAASVDYKCTVPVIADSESLSIASSSDSFAINQVTYIQRGKLTSWVETSGGKNCSSKESYTSTGDKYMNYDSNKSSSVKLNISTATTQWSTIETIGWFYS